MTDAPRTELRDRAFEAAVKYEADHISACVLGKEFNERSHNKFAAFYDGFIAGYRAAKRERKK